MADQSLDIVVRVQQLTERAFGQITDELKKLEAQAGQTSKNTAALGGTFKTATAELGSTIRESLSFRGILSQIGPSIAGAFTIGAVTSFASSIVSLGGEISDMAARLGVSVEAAQELSYAAKLTGSDVNTFGTAIGKMSRLLADGDAGAAGNLRKLGLEMTTLRQMAPDRAFTAIAEAIAGVPDPMEQSRLAVELFGKSGERVLPAIKAGMSDLREEAQRTGQVLSKENVEALDAFGDMWDRSMSSVKVGTATAVVDMSRDLSSLEGAAHLAGESMLMMFSPDLAFRLKAFRKDVYDIKDGIGELPKAIEPVIFQAEKVSPAFDFQALEREARDLTAEVQRQVRVTEEAQRKAAAYRREVDQLFGRDLIQRAADYVQKLGGIENAARLSKEKQAELTRAIDAGVEAAGRLGEAVPDTWRKIADAARPPLQATQLFTVSLIENNRHVERLATVYLPNLTGAAERAKNALNGLRADGLLPAHTVIGNIGQAIDGVKGKNVTAEVNGWLDSFRNTRTVADEMVDGLGDLSMGFRQLADVSGGALGGFLGQMADAIGLMQVGARAGQQVRAGIDQIRAGGAANVAAGALQVGAGAAQGAASLWAATDKRGRGARAASGAAQGMQIGGAIWPGWGHLIGAGAGALVGALRNPAFEDVHNRVLQRTGVGLPDEVSRAIADMAKGKFRGSRDAATVYSLDAIVGQAGGVKGSNAGKLTGLLHDAFSLTERNEFSREDLTETLDRNFGAFADHVMRSKTLATDAFTDLITLNARFKSESASIAEFVGAQTSRIGSSLSAIAGPLIAELEPLRERTVKAQAEVAKLTDAGKVGSAEYAAAKAAATEAETAFQAAVTQSGAEVQTLGLLSLDAFNRGKEAGTPMLELIGQLGPGLDSLVALQKDYGIAVEDGAAKDLIAFRDRVERNPTLVAGAEALNGLLKTRASIGQVNIDVLNAMEDQGLRTYDRLREAGFSESEAIQQIGGFLANVVEQHRRLGEPIGENTAKLIKLAEQHGALEEDGRSLTSILKGGFESVVDAINNMIAGLRDGVPAAANSAKEAIGRIPRNLDIDVTGRYHGEWVPPGSRPDEMPEAAEGIYATGRAGVATWFGEGGEPELGGPVDFMARVMARAAQRGAVGPGAGGGPIVIDARGAFFQSPGDLARLGRVVGDALNEHRRLYGARAVTG